MSSDAQDQVTAFWDMVAPGYEAHPGNVPAYGSAEYQRWADMLDHEVPGCPAEVLDLATGTGFVAMIMAPIICLMQRVLRGKRAPMSRRATDRGPRS